MTQDLSLIARQLKHETLQAKEAIERLNSSTIKGEQGAYASSTIYGQALLRTNIDRVAKRIRDRIHLLRRGTAAVDAATVFNHLKDADPNTLALLTMKVSLDVLGKESKPQLVQLTLPIGKAVETELRLNWYFKQDKDLYRQTEKYFHGSTGTRQKATVFKLRFNRAGLEWSTWSQQVLQKVGSWLLDCLMSETGWIENVVIATPRKRRSVLRYSQEFLGLKGAILQRAEELAFCHWPMVCPPNDWTNEDRGGYLTEEIRKQHPLVRKTGSLGLTKQGSIPLAMLNNLQQVGLCINKPVLDVANWAFENFRTIGKFTRETVKPVPPSPPEGATPEDIKTYKRYRREIEDYNAQLEQKNWRTTEVMYVANRYVKEERFWLPWSFDYRGRIYSLVTSLSPQGTDFDKALLLFADAGTVDPYWLAFAVATTQGQDKASMEDRITWTWNHRDLISSIATDPISNLSLWANASEPWSFLAACIEYHECCIALTRDTSGLPIGIDATQSGIQHLAALSLDGSAAALVNILPTTKPVDGYRTIAEDCIKYISDKAVHPYITRKVTKRTAMTLPYGVTRDSARGYIREGLKEEGCDLSIKGRLSEITNAIYEKAIPEIFPGPVDIMHWLQKSAKEILEHSDVIEWTTPSGFHVRQDLRVCLSERIRTRLMGSVVACQVGVGWGGPDSKHHVSALAPNVVHSMDAALLNLTFAYWAKPFTVIHDCVLGRSCDMTQMSMDIRLHFAEMYKAPVLEQWAKQVGVSIPEGLMKGTLDIERVNHSEYFFC